MQKDTCVSVIVAIYNVARYLPQCLESVLAQTFTRFECILMDDASPDSCGAICDEYARRDARIRVIHNEENKGSSLNRKIGFEQAHGEYVLFIDGDDWIDCAMLEKLYNAAASADCDMAYCDFYEYNDKDIPRYIEMKDVSPSKVENIKNFILNDSHNASMCNKLIRRDIVSRITFNTYSVGEDKYFSTQLFFLIDKSVYVRESLYHYRFNPHSQFRTRNPKRCKKKERDIQKNYQMIFDYLKSMGGDIFEPELSLKIKEMKQRLKMKPIKLCNFSIKQLIKWALPYGFVRFVQKRKSQ
jgi:glycosyltransferase involved in cell wall biosynthesis